MTTISTNSRSNASLILALIAALIVVAFDRTWLARPVAELIPADSSIRLDWLHHLKARLLRPFLLALETAMRVGRPPVERTPSSKTALDEEFARGRRRYEQKLDSGDKKDVQEWVVELYERLRKQYAITQKEFCRRMGIAVRTLRSWLRRAVRPASPPPPIEDNPPRRPRGQGRFDLEHTLPGIQQMADTTSWEFLGVKLKVMAAQDPGDRHHEPWSAFRVELAETGAMIGDLLDQKAPPGTQVVTDQGTPYMSQGDAMDDRGVDHAPCKEGTPTQKATLERSFGLIKQALAPLLTCLAAIAQQIPQLCSPAIVLKLARVLLNVFLHVYRLGHRHLCHPLAGEDPDILGLIAQQQREQAHAELQSRRLTLERIHAQYHFALPLKKFLRAYRSYALEDIQEAERRMRPAALKGSIRVPHQYFASIVNDVADAGRARRRAERNARIRLSRLRKQERLQKAHRDRLDANPVLRLHYGLDLLHVQWIGRRLLLGGAGPGRGLIRSAIQELAAKDPDGFEDDVRLECKRWLSANSVASAAWSAIYDIVERLISKAKSS